MRGEKASRRLVCRLVCGLVWMIPAIFALALVFWFSPLSFFPVPWPDDSVFFLTGWEWLRTGVYRMHSQAPWFASYDQANFNTMPGLPLLLGLGSFVGVLGVHLIRIWGVLVFALACSLLWTWSRRRGVSAGYAALLCGTALLDPVARWSAMVVRPEVWISCIWIALLMSLDGALPAPPRKKGWVLPLLLAGGAYVHFEAVIWVLPLTLGLIFSGEGPKLRGAAKKLWEVGWRTTLLLSPWIAYVLGRPRLFAEQMSLQFRRMSGPHLFVHSAYDFFHSLFIDGNGTMPVNYPKFLNLGKFAFWAALITAIALNLKRFWRDREGVRLAAVAGMISALALWLDKSEIWFVSLAHWALWPAILLLLPRESEGGIRSRVSCGFGGALALMAVVFAAVGARQWIAASANYTWDRYDRWVECIRGEIGGRKRVWQPNSPDVLVELASKDPGVLREYFRFVDFPGVEKQVEARRPTMEAVIHSQILPLSRPESQLVYRGDPRPRDVYYLTEYPWLLFNHFSALQNPEWGHVRVCQEGPFWAALSLSGKD